MGKSSKESSILGSAAKSASYNMVLQLMFRLLTFVLNAFVLRYISKDTLGVVNVRLTLLYSTVLFMSREAFRRACLSKNASEKWVQVINLVWCTIPIGCVCATVLAYVWIFLLEPPDPGVVPDYNLGVACFAASTVIEMTSEPLWVLAQNFLFVKLKVILEGGALLVKCVMVISLIVVFPDKGVIVFSIAQLVFTTVYSLAYYLYFLYYTRYGDGDKSFPLKSCRDFFPRISGRGPVIDKGLSSLTWSFFKQSFLKQILTEGERYVMTIFDVLSFSDQGVYDIVNNLGSLAARFIFLPIEDSSYLFFSQTLTRGQPAERQSQNSLQLATRVLESLLKVVTLIGVTILTFGFSYSHLALQLYGGEMLSSGTGPHLLRWYCMYVLLLAVNGITECFTFATMSKQQVDRYNQKMLVFSAIFLVSSWYLTTWLGSVGFILANCLNMAARITHSAFYTQKFYSDKDVSPLLSVLPSAPVVFVLTVAWGITSASEEILCCSRGVIPNLLHIGIGGLCVLVVLLTIYLTERTLVTFVKEQYRQKYVKHKAN